MFWSAVTAGSCGFSFVLPPIRAIGRSPMERGKRQIILNQPKARNFLPENYQFKGFFAQKFPNYRNWKNFRRRLLLSNLK
ncbi:hypothetical protein [Rhizobium dioscoreae]|uniref:hypothetical protein n=1 Tax=Rhizobium sp. TaxID=391 RepID=UPI00126122DD